MFITKSNTYRILILIFICFEVIIGQSDQTQTLIQDAVNKYYGYQYLFNQLPTPRINGGHCTSTGLDNAFYMSDIVGQLSSLLEEYQCVSVCIQQKKCISVNYLPNQKKCILLASGLSTNDLYSKNLHDTFYSNKIKSRHLILDNCFDENNRSINKKGQSQPPTDPPTVAISCGKQFYQPNIANPGKSKTRITGGMDAVPNSWPWIVSLQINGNHICGGTLLPMANGQSDIVLTAAHCVVNRDRSTISLNNFNVLLGSHSQSYIEKGEQSVPVEQFAYNPEYNLRNLIGDVAVIKLYTPVKYSNTITPICLAKPGSAIDPKSTCIVAGWGNLKEVNDQMYPDKLQQLKVPVLDDSICFSKEVWGLDFNASSRLCAGYLEGKRNVCSGDSGGPIVCNKDGQWTQVGVASFVSSEGCQVANKPGVFARVSTYNNWIVATANRLSRV